MIQAVLFDMDGILYDSEYAYMQGNIAVMRSLGYRGPAHKLYAVIGKDMDGLYQIFYELLDKKVPLQVIRKTNEAYYRVHPIDYRSIMFPGVPEVLAKLKQSGKKTACCSSSPEQLILDSLDAMGIRQYFDLAVSTDQLKHPKPDPEIYLTAAERLGVKPEACVVYEDSTDGIASGKRAGMRVIAREDLRFGQDQSQADWIVKDIYGMAEVIFREDKNAGSNQN